MCCLFLANVIPSDGSDYGKGRNMMKKIMMAAVAFTFVTVVSAMSHEHGTEQGWIRVIVPGVDFSQRSMSKNVVPPRPPRPPQPLQQPGTDVLLENILGEDQQLRDRIIEKMSKSDLLFDQTMDVILNDQRWLGILEKKMQKIHPKQAEKVSSASVCHPS